MWGRALDLSGFGFCRFGAGRRLGRVLGEVFSRGARARTELDGNAAVLQRHFNGEQNAADHELVERTEVADAEDLAGDLVEAEAKRRVVAIVGRLS